MMTHVFNEIKNQIVLLWKNYDKDGNMEDIIEEFKHYYGNHENSIYYYDFDPYLSQQSVMCCQRFIISKMEDAGYDMLVSDMLSIATMEGLKKHLLYWIMEDIDFTTISSN